MNIHTKVLELLNCVVLDEGQCGDINTYMPELWTIRKLFDKLAISYDVHPVDNVIYDHDLSYKSFSYDKLEKLFNAQGE